MKRPCQKLGFPILFLLSQTSCMFGNYSVNPAAPQSQTDTISGYYETLPQSFTLLATLNQTTHQSSIDIKDIPTAFTQILTNPVAVLLMNSTSGLATVVNPNDANANLSIFVKSDLSFSYSKQGTPLTHWLDPNCTSFVVWNETGKLDQTTPPPSIPNDSHTLSGSLKITIQVSTEILGDCGPTFHALAACYQDSTQCGGSSPDENASNQTKVINAYQPWVDAQVITPAEIADLTNYSFVVSYQ